MNKLWVRLSIAFLLIAWLSIGAMAIVVQRTTDAGFRQYVVQRNASEISLSQISRLERYYADRGAWSGAETAFGGQGQNGRRGASFSVIDAQGNVLASTDATLVDTVLDARAIADSVELKVNGAVVGYLHKTTPGTEALGAAETAFLNEASSTLLMAAAVVSTLAVVIAVGLAWLLARPLNRLTDTILELTRGTLGPQVDVHGTAEVEALAQAFNTMSTQLAEGEALRRRMAADVAHELRTPVSVLRGHLEAMRDGVFPLDQEHLAVAHDQTLYLGRLVDDLRLLTLAEARHLPLNQSAVSPADLVGEIADGFRPLALDADVSLIVNNASAAPLVSADAMRIRQVLGNLLTNALRHTPSGGEISIDVLPVGKQVRFTVSNTGSPLDADAARQVFAPFWRATETRERDTGGSGLGLAISKQLIELHGGKMWVETRETCTSFVFELPNASLLD